MLKNIKNKIIFTDFQNFSEFCQISSDLTPKLLNASMVRVQTKIVL